MPLIQLSEVSLAFGHVPLLDHVDLVIEPGRRIGLIGRNGTGKSSLLRVIEGTSKCDDGKVWRAPDLKLATVSQEPLFEPGLTVFEAVAEGLGKGNQLLVEYHAAAHAFAEDHENEALAARMHELQEQLDATNGWSLQHKVDSTLTRLSLDPDRKVDELSGGLKKRVALARALVLEPGLLLLDEPTNHLDVASIEWLEGVMQSYPGSVLFVTHDRSFLDSVANEIIELDRGYLTTYSGNFSAYQIRKAEDLATEAVHNRKFDKFLAQEEVWIRKGVEARRTRNEGRVLRLEQLRLERAARRERVGKVELQIGEAERSGKLVAELEGVTKTYGGRDVVKDFSCRLLRGDKIGLIGPNGSGKTTLLKLILGEIQPDAGTVQLGTKLAVAYFDQFRAGLDEEATLSDTINPGADFVEVDGIRKHVISYLGDFLFPPERAKALVKSLSGGERNRLLLARLFSRPANVLVLDEPTNDLDIETLELLEELLQTYKGTLFLVSHDRTFLDNVVTQTIASEGEGGWKEYAGGYSDWQRFSKAGRAEAKAEAVREEKKAATAQKKPAKVKLNYKESRELADLPGRIDTLEKEQAAIAARLSDPALYQDKADEAVKLQKRTAQIEDELLAALTRWEELDARK
ncbi:MAG: ATP-binding cassette domain-containing protein [Burkholderiales bacterium]